MSSPSSPTPQDHAETRAAIRLVAVCASIAILVYFAVAIWVTPDARWTRLGWDHELEFVLRDARQYAHADGPVTFILGSSITREAFDSERVQARLRAAGEPDSVQKFAFNRGAPVFTHGVVRDLPIRPGDTVVTSVAEDNFVRGWLVETADFDSYVEFALDPDEILTLADVPVSTRLEWALSGLPPRDFHRHRESFRRGLVRDTNALLRGKPWPRAKGNVGYQPYSDAVSTLRPERYHPWEVDPALIQLEPGVSNWDRLIDLERVVNDRGATLLIVVVPPHPAYYERFLSPDVFERVWRSIRGRFPTARALRPRTGVAYFDYKHPNNYGRSGFSDELADVILRSRGRPVPAGADDAWLARTGEAPEAVVRAAADP